MPFSVLRFFTVRLTAVAYSRREISTHVHESMMTFSLKTSQAWMHKNNAIFTCSFFLRPHVKKIHIPYWISTYHRTETNISCFLEGYRQLIRFIQVFIFLLALFSFVDIKHDSHFMCQVDFHCASFSANIVILVQWHFRKQLRLLILENYKRVLQHQY